MHPDQTLRLFIAVDLSPAVKALMAELQSQLRRHTAALRLSDPAGTHLTLKFLGAVPAGQVAAVEAALRQAAAGHAPFRLRTTALGTFPNARRPRVVWLGVGGDLEALGRLKDDVERWVAPLGYPTEQRPFSPHLTLGRSPKQPGSADLAGIAGAVAAVPAPGGVELDVDGVVLMRSELMPQGARYTPLAAARLDARS